MHARFTHSLPSLVVTQKTDDDTPDGTDKLVVNERYCSSLLKKPAAAAVEFPPECYRFESVRTGVIRRDSKRGDDAVAFAGMDPGSAIQAMSARDHGHPHTAQITRRLTSKSKPSESSWF